MMAAMMLPSVAPTASLYAKTFRETGRWVTACGGYLAAGQRPACPHTGCWPLAG